MAYNQAAEDQAVVQHAPGALREAKQVLSRAEQAWRADKNVVEVEHLSYLTEQRVAIARAKTDNQTSEADRRRLSQEREVVLREARIEETDQARREAEQARREAEQARREAEQARTRQEETVKQMAMLREQLGTLKAKETSRGTVLTLGSVLFAPGKAHLKSEALQNLYALVTFMRDNPQRTAIVEGYTDNAGSDEFNLDLSQRRAEAVRDFLIKNGVGVERITARGYGEASPVASNDTEAGRQQNRRVEIVLPK
jgi:outer membrane protein OmpA-like peptidoglycan-associated protein